MTVEEPKPDILAGHEIHDRVTFFAIGPRVDEILLREVSSANFGLSVFVCLIMYLVRLVIDIPATAGAADANASG